MDGLKKYILIILILLLVFSTGCSDKNILDKDKLDIMIENYVKETDIAIANNDIKKARKVWSELTELSIRAKDNSDLSESVEKLSTNYVKLITYLESGEDNLLADFRKDFDDALDYLKETIESLSGDSKKEG